MRSLFRLLPTLAALLAFFTLAPLDGARAATADAGANAKSTKSAAANASRAKTEASSPRAIDVLVLGTYHMGNPGQDLNNLQADDVTSAKRQAEIADVARRLERFRPTKVMLEFVSDEPDRRVARYERFTPADLAASRDERVQLGFRIAHDLGHARVYGIDEQSDTIDYFPFDRVQEFAKKTGREAELEPSMQTGAAFVARMAALQTSGTVGDLLRWLNEPAVLEQGHRDGYLGVLALGSGKEFPGAELNAMWFLRNAKIFAKLVEVAKPGDRVLVVYGAGHGYWLRELARGTPGFRLVDANEYLGRR
jgi:hypothetical protein